MDVPQTVLALLERYTHASISSAATNSNSKVDSESGAQLLYFSSFDKWGSEQLALPVQLDPPMQHSTTTTEISSLSQEAALDGVVSCESSMILADVSVTPSLPRQSDGMEILCDIDEHERHEAAEQDVLNMSFNATQAVPEGFDATDLQKALQQFSHQR